MSTAPTSTVPTLDDFVALSAILTGIAAGKLQPAIDTHDTAQAYFDQFTTRSGPTFAGLVAAYVANKDKTPQQIADVIFNQSGSAIAFLARSVMLMWYLASWYDPAQLQNPPPTGLQSTIVSADAYTQGWVWPVAQTHPMGYSEWTFGYWKQDPPPLSAFIGGNGS